MSRTAIILTALGGPRDLAEVEHFMAAFLGRPAPEQVVSAVRERYKLIGGRSPLPEIVKAQADELGRVLGGGFRVYEGFAYSRPMISEAVARAVSEGAKRVIGLSMSPFETAVTSGVYKAAFEGADNKIPKLFIPSWHNNPLFINAWVEKIQIAAQAFGSSTKTAWIFTSHSIPKRYIEDGDPYLSQIQETVALITTAADIKHWRIAWQSKGARASEPWLEPEVEPTIDRLKSEGFEMVIEVPVGFTCDHMETLYDIDIVHRNHAEKIGMGFGRVESLNTSSTFIRALADIVKRHIS